MQEELGAGAQATVYKGINRKNNQKVAIKVRSLRRTNAPQRRARCGAPKTPDAHTAPQSCRPAPMLSPRARSPG
eukprot:5624667-Prymnesium_polylepis.2